jgi:hypothetical protein
MVQTVRPPIQPREALWLTINFDAKDALLTGDSLATLSSFVCTKVTDGTVVTSTMVETGSPTIIGNKVTFLKKAGGGTDGEDYKYTTIVTTTLGETLEEDLIVQIRET